jgi:uncharacterized protein YqeY
MDLKQQIVDDLTTAMKAKDAAKTGALRMVKAAIMNREKEKAQGAVLADDETMKVLRVLVKQRRDSIEQYDKAGRTDLSQKEAEELKFIEAYLPQAASREEIESAVSAAIAETGASSPKEMGAVMKAAQAKLVGRNADGKTVSELVKAALSQ